MNWFWRIVEKVLYHEDSEQEKLLGKKKIKGQMPLNDAGFFSYMTIAWLTPLVLKLFKDRSKEIREDDVWACSDLESCGLNTDRLDPLWTEELQTHGPKNCSVRRLWLKFIWRRMMVVFLALCFNAVITFLLAGYMTAVITRYIEEPGTSVPFVVGISIITIIGQILRICSYTFVLFYGTHTGLRFRSAILGISYKKLLKLKNMNGKTASEVITIVGSDAFRVSLNTALCVFLLSLPVYMVIGTVYLYSLIGLWCFVVFAIFMGFYLLQVCLIEISSILRRRTLKWTDIRLFLFIQLPLKESYIRTIWIRKLTEVLTSMKLIKMYAWEEPFKNSIMGIRSCETRPLLKVSILSLISNSLIAITPSLATMATIASFVNAGNELTAATGFSIVATLNYMRVVVAFIPYAGRIFGETLISFERIKRFMLEEEFKPPNRHVLNLDNCIELRDTVLMWNGDNNNNPDGHMDSKQKEVESDMNNKSSLTTSLVLRNIDIEIKRGRHIGICGAVGCGKSSLLQALIGRMPLLSGHLAIDGSVAYAAQQAWIFNGTLRENVLFGSSFKKDWYDRVIQACSLEPDLRILANGDMTEIGDRGINLSGGQKQRVSLARAVYSKRDIYLLDDPLSAVDVQVGKHLFHKCIDTLLKDKTVVLVTHQLQYLEHCDEVYVLDEGEIVEHGSHEVLLCKDGHYKKLIEQFHSNMDQAQNTDDISEIVDEDISTHNDNTSKQSEGRTEEKYKEEDYDKGILTDRETSQIGTISSDSYGSYIRQAGGGIVAFLVLLLYVVAISSTAFCEWWLGIWIQTVQVHENNLFAFNESGSNFPISANTSTASLDKVNNTIIGIEKLQEDSNWYLMVYVYSTITLVVLCVLKGLVAGGVMTNASVNLHNEAVGRVMSAPMQYFDANPPGRLLNRFSRDVEEVDIFIPNLTDNLLQIFIMILASLVSTAYNLPVYLIAVFLVAFYVYIIKVIATIPLLSLKRLENVVRSPLLSHVTTSCSGLNTIVSFSQENNFMNACKRYSDSTTVGLALYEACIRWMGLRVDFGSSVLTIITCIVVLVTKGTLPPSLAALSVTMAMNVTSLAQFCARMLCEVESRFISVERLHEYESIDIEKETGNSQVDKSWPRFGRITFLDVVMKYRADMDPVLQNINFDILPRQKVGIVGRTGAGKSSLAAALFRLTDISEGHVLVDDMEIRSISRKLLRSKLSSIPQDPVLFAGTLRYNLDPFDEYTDAQMWNALHQVHMKEKMRALDQTLDLNIQENGENFSVGERQLICLARAILRQNKILILDEATASIDTSTDALIQETIRENFSDCTVLTIAHRLNTVLHCDVILVMESGRVKEMGHPQTLIQNPLSHFSKMIRAQSVAPNA